MSAERYLKRIPLSEEVTFIPRTSSPSGDNFRQLYTDLYGPHYFPNGKFKDGGPSQRSQDAFTYQMFRLQFYHRVIYHKLSRSDLVAQASSTRYVPMPADCQSSITLACRALSEYFPVGKYVAGEIIVDESTIFLDCLGNEIACYDREIRELTTSQECADALLEVLCNSPIPHKDVGRHSNVQICTNVTADPDIANHQAQFHLAGVKHVCWARFPRVKTQGPVVSKHLLDTQFLRCWDRRLKLALQPLFLQGSLVLRVRDKSLFNRYCNQVNLATGAKYGSAGTAFMPLRTMPFNGCALIFYEDTYDHRDKNNAPGAYGVTQPLGNYPAGEGTITLTKLGVQLLYQPTDTLSADFFALSHFTKPLSSGYRYCVASFLHEEIYRFRATASERKADNERKEKWLALGKKVRHRRLGEQ